jgi:hypothetical protein
MRAGRAEIGRTNAPCLLHEMDGDFSAEVRVSGPFPGDPRCLTEGRWAFRGRAARLAG